MKVSTSIWSIISCWITSNHSKTYITINDAIGSKTIDLSYPIRSGKEISVIKVLSDNVQYKVIKSHIVNYTSPEDEKPTLSGTYAGRELLSVSGGMIELNLFAKDDRVFKINKLRELQRCPLI